MSSNPGHACEGARRPRRIAHDEAAHTAFEARISDTHGMRVWRETIWEKAVC